MPADPTAPRCAPCAAQHPLTHRACMLPRGHAGAHHSSGPGYSDQWQAVVDIDQRTPGGGRIRIRAAEITISREDS